MSAQTTTTRPAAPVPAAPAGDRAKVFDRSSFEGDFLVTIPGQTAEDFERYAPEGQFCEYFDGTVYMPSPVSERHQDLVGFLFDILNGFRLARGTGKILLGPAVLRLTPERKPEPDVFVRPVAGMGQPAAVLVIEVLSPSNRWYDLDLKSSFYREAGIPEIWYLDDRDKVLIVDRRQPDGTYQVLRLTSGTVEVASLPGFWLDVSWLWVDPLPNPRQCLEAILAGPPPG